MKSRYPLVILIVSNQVSKESQQEISSEGLYPTNASAVLALQHLYHAWTKLRVFQMIDLCKKCVFMDADMVVLKNIDELFELEDDPNFAAVQTCICNPRKTASYPEYWKPENCPYTNEPHIHKAHAATDERSRVFNSGLFVFHPNLTVFDQMITALDTWDLTDFQFADQSFLNKFYNSTWHSIPPIYNMLKTFSKTHPDIWDESKVKVVHFILDKPWETSMEGNSKYEHVHRLWWEAYHWRPE